MRKEEFQAVITQENLPSKNTEIICVSICVQTYHSIFTLTQPQCSDSYPFFKLLPSLVIHLDPDPAFAEVNGKIPIDLNQSQLEWDKALKFQELRVLGALHEVLSSCNDWVLTVLAL